MQYKVNSFCQIETEKVTFPLIQLVNSASPKSERETTPSSTPTDRTGKYSSLNSTQNIVPSQLKTIRFRHLPPPPKLETARFPSLNPRMKDSLLLTED
jgi:hypothetical protein